MRLSKIIILSLLFFYNLSASSQEVSLFHFNNKNGLTSNHVYFTKVDKLGYLWIGTPDGLFRYNGYSFKRYGYNEGLTNLDVWALTEDSKGRMWVHSISSGLGYIYNNEYKEVYVSENSTNKLIYPSVIKEVGDSVILSNHNQSKYNSFDYGIVYNDTFYWQKLEAPRGTPMSYFIADKVLEVYPDSTHVITELQQRIRNKTGAQKRSTTKLFNLIGWASERLDFLGRAFFFKIGDTCINFYDAEKDSLSTIGWTSANGRPRLKYAYPYKDSCYLLTDEKIRVIDSSFSIVKEYSINSLFPKANVSLETTTYFINDKNWGTVLSTSNDGVIINMNSKKVFHKSPIDFTGYKFLNSERQIGFWWNSTTKSLKKIDSNLDVKTQHLPKGIDLYKIRAINDKTTIFCSGVYTLLNSQNEYRSFEQLSEYKREFIKYPKLDTLSLINILRPMHDAIHIDSNSFYSIASGVHGVNKITIDTISKTIFIENISKIRYKSGCHNANLKMTVIFTNDKIVLIADSNSKEIVIGNKNFSQTAVLGIQNVVLDDYGNIFIKDYNSLKVYNLYTAEYKPLFSNYNLEKSHFDLTENRLSLAGSFGVLRCNVTGICKVKNIKAYLNTKSIYYKEVIAAQFSKNNVLINTDNGAYHVNIDTLNYTSTNSFTNYIISYNDSLIDIHENDTVLIHKFNSNIKFDLVRPIGFGTLTFKYSMDGIDYPTADEIPSSIFKTGKYHNLTIVASDNSWVGQPIRFVVYLHPKWWQTNESKIVLSLITIIALCGFIFLIVVITRKRVLNKNERRSFLINLELKSIHSQINPHFIFNTLNTALFLVKNKQNEKAFKQINHFSQLLRAYIKSSRKKYISIADEIENLDNYLQLQLFRFKKLFTYKFVIDKIIDTDTTLIPSLILQPIVENAINHGIFHKENEEGKLIISFESDINESNVLVIKIDDNGVGREEAKKIEASSNKKHDSIGNTLIRELIETFNKYERIEISITYTDKIKPETGTIVEIRIKNYENAK